MKIDCELTKDEQDALAMLMGLGQGAAIRAQMFPLAIQGINVLNKLFAKSPRYVPYDANSFDPESEFPFKRMDPQ